MKLVKFGNKMNELLRRYFSNVVVRMWKKHNNASCGPITKSLKKFAKTASYETVLIVKYHTQTSF